MFTGIRSCQSNVSGYLLLHGVLILLSCVRVACPGPNLPVVEQWGMFELTLPGPADGNPFIDVRISARFYTHGRSFQVDGFYDSDGLYKVRFMPDQQGQWEYLTSSSVPMLDAVQGRFVVTSPTQGNHGPVRVANTFHFVYADGTPYRPVGTTLYAWIHQPEELQQQTIKTLTQWRFNKVRMCVFPKHYSWNANEPPLYPFDGTPPRTWDFSRFNPAFFRHLEQRILDLQRLGIEADLILFHPYDKGHWGFDRMMPTDDERYVRYLVARLAAFRNVWWSLANEFDFIEQKTERDWERIGQLVWRTDPYGHLLSIHNGARLFNYTLPWITHASIQMGSAVEHPHSAVILREAYRKPVIYDEIKYEGDIPRRWGNLSAEELVFRFWNAAIAGTYATHGETYLSTDQVLWWSKGGVLKGQSPARLIFLRQILEDCPQAGIEPVDKWQNPEYAGQPPDFYLVYLGKDRHMSWQFLLPRSTHAIGHPPQEGMRYTAEVIDTWDMIVTEVPGMFTITRKDDYFYVDKDGRRIDLPGRPYMAIRIKRVKD